MEVVGYGFRAYSNKNPFYVNAFIIQYFFIVVVSGFNPHILYAFAYISLVRPPSSSLLLSILL